MIGQLFGRFRARKIGKILLKELNRGEKLLDVGAGTMEVAKNLYSAGMLVEGVDVIDINNTELPFKIFDGINLPYPNKSFDVVLLVFVLHHVERHQQENLLRECLRVAKRAVIVTEDVFKNPIERKIVELFDRSNLILSSEMYLPLSFRSERQWKNIFGKFSLQNILVKTIRPVVIRPTRHRMFVLEK